MVYHWYSEYNKWFSYLNRHWSKAEEVTLVKLHVLSFCYIAASLHRIQSNSRNLLAGSIVLALIYMHFNSALYVIYQKRKKFLGGRRTSEKYANYYDKVRGKKSIYILVKKSFIEKYQHAIDNVRRTRFHVTTIAA